MTIADHTPSSSGRNAHCCAPHAQIRTWSFNHPAHASGAWRQTAGPAMGDELNRVTTVGGHAFQSLPTEVGSLATPTQRPYPQPLQPAAERTDVPARPWNGVVVEPACVDPPKPRTDFQIVVVPSLARDLIDALQGSIDPFGDRIATKPKASSPGRRAVVHEAQEVERFRLTRHAMASVHQPEPPKLHEAGLVPAAAETKPAQPLQDVEKGPRVHGAVTKRP